MSAGLLLAAIALDLALVFIAASATGFSRAIGPFRIRLHDPSTPLLVAAVLCGCLVAATWRGRRRGWALASVVAVVGIAGVELTRSAERMFPVGDIAVLEMYVRDALTGHLMVGPYSRFLWHHPGPLYFYLIAPVYAVGGANTAVLATGASILSEAALAILVWTSARSLGSPVSLILLGSTAAYLWRVQGLVASAWNPHVIVLPTMALVVIGAAAAGGDIVLLPLVAVLASFIVQTDVALVPVAAVIVTASAVAGVTAARRRPGGPTVLASLNLTAWVTAVLWFATAAEQFTHTPGNITMLWRFFVSGGGRGQTFSAAASAWAAMIASPLGRTFSLATGGTFSADAPAAALVSAVAQLLALAAVVVWANRHRQEGLARLALFSLLASLVALWSVTRIEGRIMDHEVFWLSGIGALNLGIAAAALVLHLRLGAARRMQTPTPTAAVLGALHGVLVAGCVFICFVQLERAHAGRLPVTVTSPIAERFSESVRSYTVDRGVRKWLVRIGEDVWGDAAGTLLQLDRAGVRFAVEDSWLSMFPQSFAASGDEDAELAFIDTDEHMRRAGRPDNVLVTNSATVYVDAEPIGARRHP